MGRLHRSACESTLRGFMPLDLDAPGLTVLHLDPPIFTAEHLLSDEECQNLINAAEATGGRAFQGVFKSLQHVFNPLHAAAPTPFSSSLLLRNKNCDGGAGQLRASLVGAGNAAEEAVNAMTTRRTSRSMLLQDDILAAHPRLGQLAGRLQQRARALLQPGVLLSGGCPVACSSTGMPAGLHPLHRGMPAPMCRG